MAATEAVKTLPTASPFATTIVQFARRQWATRDAQLTLTLTATAELAWSPSSSSLSPNIFHTASVPASRVSHLVRIGRLWIGSSGRSVELAVRLSLAGRSISTKTRGSAAASGDASFVDKLHEAILEWQPWKDDLGVLVRHEQEGRDGSDALHFAVSHPPSPGGLYSPRAAGISQARFDRVVCQFSFSFCPNGFDLPGPLIANVLPSKQHTSPGKKGRGKRKKAAPTRQKKTTGTPKRISRGLTDPNCLCDMAAWKKVLAMIETAFSSLVGVPRRQLAVRPLNKMSIPGGAPSLLDVAPAVWSNHSFKAVASRAVYLPLIHRALASFTNAQSPSLRRKAEALTRDPIEMDEESTDALERSPFEGLDTKLEELLLKSAMISRRHSRRPPPKSPTAQRNTPRMTPSNDGTAENSQRPLSSVPSLVSSSQAEELLPCAEPEESQYHDVCVDDLEHTLFHSPDESHSGNFAVQDDDGEGGRRVDWEDIEAWTELGEWLGEEDENEDATFEEINSSWSPSGQGACGSGEEENEAEELCGSLLVGNDAVIDWQDVQDWQLDAWPAFDNQQTYLCPLDDYDEEFEAEYMDLDEIDLDEGIGLWRNEDELVQYCL